MAQCQGAARLQPLVLESASHHTGRLAKQRPLRACRPGLAPRAGGAAHAPPGDRAPAAARQTGPRAPQAVRAKRTAAARDAVPDEAFGRVRGALFFGPAFRVTRNKLTFRDNLAELLAAASPGAPLVRGRVG